MKVVKRDKVIFHFSSRNRPVETVDLGEVFIVETNDCYMGQIKTERDLRPNIDASVKNAATGPVKISGVSVSDWICVKIIDIELASRGVMIAAPGHGILGDLVTEADTKVIRIENNEVLFSDEIRFRVEPMIGVIGVAPGSGAVHCAVPGDHGGNMDIKDIRPGSRVYFKVNHGDVGLAMGDLHAKMADGEISGSGVEMEGSVKLCVTKAPDFGIDMPVVETGNEFLLISSEGTIEKAIRKGVSAACSLMQKSLNLKFSDAYRLASIACDVRICQIVNPIVTVRVAVPKQLVSGYSA